MRGLIAKSLVFATVTILATALLASVIRNDVSGSANTYTAMFSDATSLNLGDDVRMAGVKVGTIQDISVADDPPSTPQGSVQGGAPSVAEVEFSVTESTPMHEGATAELRFRNLVGQRYISLEPADDPGPQLEPGATFSLDETRPALDLTMLFNGFQPLLKFLDPEDVNNLSAQMIAVFQGEGATVESLISSTASLTSTLADKDQVIGELIESLSGVLQTVNDRSDQLDTTLITLDALVTGLAEDRETIGSTLDGLGRLTTSVSSLLEEGRAPLKSSITSLGDLSQNLSDSEDVLDDLFETMPVKLDRLGRLASYGSWFNFYLCSIDGSIPLPEGYLGDRGADNPATRCT
ncbi:MCE family protein [Aeromicrobium sp. CF4.19]|uniref:MCE family protein n=1 Tax=Aeromicrobium sp. CF4.19 TaxID=3373082 RepID=UPI003EE5AC9C